MTDLSTVNRSVWLEVHSGLGISLMDHLYNRMEGIYPQRWKANFPSSNSIQNWRDAWAEAFEEDRITPQDVAAGIKACRKKYDWPPSLPEFLKACRPPLGYENLYVEAAKAIDTGKWTNKLAYWSAQSVGAFNVRNEPYKRMESMWKKAVDELQLDQLPEIPPRAEALPAPGQQSISQEEARKRTAEIGVKVGTKTKRAGKEWALKILAAPENYPAISAKFAMQAMASTA